MSNAYRSLLALVGVAGVLLVAAVALAPRDHVSAALVCADSAPIQWTVASGGNGHWYQRLCFDDEATPISWQAAQTTAEGQGRYLATITSAAENEFILANLITSCGCNYWAGGSQAASQASTDAGWSWVNGEGPFSYTNWTFDNEPNDQDTDPVVEDNEENCLEVSESGTWNDQSCGPDPGDPLDAQLIEWEDAPTCDTPPGEISGANVIVGTNGSNILTGTSGKDAIFGLGGSDIIRGLGDDDLLCGGDGNDIVLGGDGNDRIEGGSGNDTLTGNADDDAMFGDAGNDLISGSTGTNTIDGGAGWDICGSPAIGPSVVGCFP